MKLYSWNVNGLRACLTKGFLDFAAQSDADVICLQETKLQPEQVDFELPGYQMFWNSAEKRLFRHCDSDPCSANQRYLPLRG